MPDAHIVQEKASGHVGSDRPRYAALLRRLMEGDRLVVWKVDRLGRSTLDALQTAKDLDARGIHIVITTLGIDLKTPAGRLVFGMMAPIAEFERELIRDRVKAGLADAKQRGIYTGREHRLRAHQRLEAVRLHREEGKSIGAIAELFACGRTVVHRHQSADRLMVSGLERYLRASCPSPDPMERQSGYNPAALRDRLMAGDRDDQRHLADSIDDHEQRGEVGQELL